MAQPFADFTSAVRDRYSSVISDGVLEAQPIWAEIQRANGPPRAYGGTIGGEGGIVNRVGGNNFQWRVASAQPTRQGFGPTAEIEPTIPDLLVDASLGMAGTSLSYFIPQYELMSLNHDEEFINLLQFYEEWYARTWINIYEEMFLLDGSTAAPPEWSGLATFMVNTGTYATNIDMTAGYATPSIFDYATNNEQFDVTILNRLTTVQNNATHGDSQGAQSGPQVAFFNRTDWQKTKNLIEDSRNIVDTDVDMLRLGFRNFVYNGMRCYWADSLGSNSLNKVYLLDCKYLGVAHPGTRIQIASTATSLRGVPGVYALSLHKGQAFCTNTRCQGLIDNTTS